MEEGTKPVKPCNVLPRYEVHPSNISGRHVRDTDTGSWHIAYRLGPHAKNPYPEGVLQQARGPAGVLLIFFINIQMISLVGQVTLSFIAQRQMNGSFQIIYHKKQHNACLKTMPHMCRLVLMSGFH